jgi:segregation and condensation protein B
MAKSLKLILEALLFASDKPLALKEIHAVLPEVKPADLAGALRVLKYEYEAMGRSFALHEVGGGFQFRSRPEYGAYILNMLQASPARLSRATMETLAIIAYKQPVLRQEIERLRGVDVGGILKTLLEKGLVKIMGRKNLPGRPLVYGTTRKFLEVFDLKDIESLPKIKELKALGSEDDEQQNLFDQKPGQEEISSEEAPSQKATAQEGPSPESEG